MQEPREYDFDNFLLDMPLRFTLKLEGSYFNPSIPETKKG
jgi:hypothetical protein